MSNSIDQFNTGITPTWCPGCGNFGIWLSLKQALIKLSIPNHRVVIVYGVGCHGNMRDWMKVYGVQGLHGRALPVAQGIKLANNKLTVIAVTGDGDCIGEGGNHFLHAAKKNPNITVIIHDNQVYGLTTGQASPTAQKGLETKSTPQGVMEPPVNPLSLAIVAGGTFVSRGFSGDIPHLTDTFSKAIAHKGFSVVDTLQPCVTFDKVHTYEWYRKRIYKIEHPMEKREALDKSMEWGEKIPVGVFYEEQKETLEDREGVDGLPLVDAPLGIPARDLFISAFR
jgi:2-oxoglutarate ferredoxin oxidoreductase subunit beta